MPKIEKIIERADEHYENEEYEKAFKLFKQAADAENAYAQYSLGYMYYNGQGVDEDKKRGVSLILKAAGEENEDALEWLEENGDEMQSVMADGFYELEDYGEAFALYMKTAENGYAHGQYSVGFMYANGEGVDKNEALAVNWMQKAAKQEHEDAIEWLADYKGNNAAEKQAAKLDAVKERAEEHYGRKEYAEAARFYQEAAKGGDAYSQYSLGYMLRHGQGVVRNLNAAKEWLVKAVNNGNKSAEKELDIIIKEMEAEAKPAAMTRSKIKTLQETEAEAHAGDSAAQFEVGLYREHDGETSVALQWYKKAAAQGHKDAANALKRLTDRIESANIPTVSDHNKYERMFHFVHKQYSYAYELTKKMAEAGDPDAMGDLGWMLMTENNPGGEKQGWKIRSENYSKGLDWLKKAAEAGEPIAIKFFEDKQKI